MTNKISLIIATDRSGAIGVSSGELPWNLPDDLANFKKYTTNKIVVIGYNTYCSIKEKFPDGFPNRTTVVVTKNNRHNVPRNLKIISDLSQIIDLKEKYPNTDIVIAGGAKIYTQALALGIVDEISLTCVHTDTNADVQMQSPYLYNYNQFIANQKENSINWKIVSLSAFPAKPTPILTFYKEKLSIEEQFKQEMDSLEKGQILKVKPKYKIVTPESHIKNDFSFTLVKLVKTV